MPYIKNERRDQLDSIINDLVKKLKENSDGMHGDLNYIIAKMVDGCLGEDLSYKKLQDMVGMIECAKLEIIRKLINNYEDKKCLENGEVFKNR